MTVLLLLCAALATDGDPVAILKRADAATMRVKQVRYHARAWGDGALAGQIDAIDADVCALRPGKGQSYLRLRATVRPPGSKAPHEHVIIRGPDHITNTVDGKTTTLDSRDGAAQVQPILSAVWMRELSIDHAFRDELNADLQQYEGVKTIGGVECHVVYVAYANRRGEARWYFGKRDFLPRRVDRILATGSRVLEISDLDTSPKLDPAIFGVEPDNARAAPTSQAASPG